MIDEAYVRAVAQRLQLELSSQQVARVELQLQRIEVIAQPLFDVELDPMTDEMAPVWRP